MNVYRDGSTVKVTIPYADESGNAVTPTAVSYRVLDADNAELVADTPIAYVDGDLEATITVDAIHNMLAEGVTRALRTIELTMVTAEGTIAVSERYVIEADAVLVVGSNTFQTYSKALLTAMDVSNIRHWDVSSERARKAALIDAYLNICKLTFAANRSDYDYINWNLPINLRDLNADGIANLEPKFQAAVLKAQIAEADFILGGDSIEDKRRMGLMSETVGESSNMFRPTKPLVLPVSERALKYLHGYIVYGVGLGRA